MEFLYLIGAVVVVVLIKGIYDRITYKKKTLKKIRDGFGKLPGGADPDRLSVVDGFFMHKVTAEPDKFHLDNITRSDLETDLFFLNSDTCKSQAGSEYYYYLLNSPCFSEEELEEREKLIGSFLENEKERTDIQYILSLFGRTKRVQLFSCIETLDDIKNVNIVNAFMPIVLLLVSAILIFTLKGAGVVFLVLSVTYNIITYFRTKGDMYSALYGIQKLCLMLTAAERIEKMHVPFLSGFEDTLKENIGKLKTLKRGAFAINNEVNGSILQIFTEYINILLHLDIIRFSFALKNAKGNRKALTALYEAVGFIDAVINIANLRAAFTDYCIPEHTKDKCLKFTDLYHPMLSNPVPASLETEKSILITGSNASGKSTFLRAVALNAVLSQTIHMCFSKSYSSCFFKVYSSMELTDDLSNGESYYMAEIHSIKRIIEENDAHPALVFIDEVLRGTNTVERIASSTSVLSYLSGLNFLVFAATHDIELTELLKDTYENYHFDESIDENGIISFDYKLKTGPSETKNAIRLLKQEGYPDEITDAAEKQAEQFIMTGKWSR